MFTKCILRALAAYSNKLVEENIHCEILVKRMRKIRYLENILMSRPVQETIVIKMPSSEILYNIDNPIYR